MTSFNRFWFVVLALDALWLGTLISVLIDVEWMFHAGRELGDYLKFSPKHDTVVSFMSAVMAFWLAIRLIDMARWLDYVDEPEKGLENVSTR